VHDGRVVVRALLLLRRSCRRSPLGFAFRFSLEKQLVRFFCAFFFLLFVARGRFVFDSSVQASRIRISVPADPLVRFASPYNVFFLLEPLRCGLPFLRTNVRLSHSMSQSCGDVLVESMYSFVFAFRMK